MTQTPGWVGVREERDTRIQQQNRQLWATHRVGHESAIRVIDYRRKCAVVVQEHHYLLAPGSFHYLLEHVQSWWVAKLFDQQFNPGVSSDYSSHKSKNLEFRVHVNQRLVTEPEVLLTIQELWSDKGVADLTRVGEEALIESTHALILGPAPIFFAGMVKHPLCASRVFCTVFVNRVEFDTFIVIAKLIPDLGSATTTFCLVISALSSIKLTAQQSNIFNRNYTIFVVNRNKRKNPKSAGNPFEGNKVCNQYPERGLLRLQGTPVPVMQKRKGNWRNRESEREWPP